VVQRGAKFGGALAAPEGAGGKAGPAQRDAGPELGQRKGARGKASSVLANVGRILALEHYVIEIVCVSDWIRTMASAFGRHASPLCENAVPAAV
jgi:hypothetical protein